MRGFFAFGVGAEFSRELRAVVHKLPAHPLLKPLQPADYHITIKFLSEFSSTIFFDCLPELCALGAPSLSSLIAGKLAQWPTVLVLECEPSDELRAWHGRVNELLERKGFIKERHPHFLPHITLARGKAQGNQMQLPNAFSGRIVPLESPMLWKSQAEETGRRHLPLLSPLFSRAL